MGSSRLEEALRSASAAQDTGNFPTVFSRFCFLYSFQFFILYFSYSREDCRDKWTFPPATSAMVSLNLFEAEIPRRRQVAVLRHEIGLDPKVSAAAAPAGHTARLDDTKALRFPEEKSDRWSHTAIFVFIWITFLQTLCIKNVYQNQISRSIL